MMIPFINVSEVIFYNAATRATNGSLSAQPGDFLLVKGKTSDLFSKLIRFGQSLRSNRKFAGYTHAAMFIDTSGNLIEAEAKGVRTTHISKYNTFDLAIVRINASDADRVHAIAFAKACENDGYGFMTLVSIGLSLLTGLKFSFGFDGQEICSGLVASCLFMCGQWLDHDPSHVTPADLAEHYIGIAAQS